MNEKARLFAYCAGWTAGAGRKPIQTPERWAADYDRGYIEGQNANRAAAQAEAARMGVTLGVLRLASSPAPTATDATAPPPAPPGEGSCEPRSFKTRPPEEAFPGEFNG